jgi:hypothetical protein
VASAERCSTRSFRIAPLAVLRWSERTRFIVCER